MNAAERKMLTDLTTRTVDDGEVITLLRDEIKILANIISLMNQRLKESA